MRTLLFVAILIAGKILAQETSPEPTPSPTVAVSTPSPSLAPGKITASLSRNVAGEPETEFASETPEIFLRWQSETIVAGDRVRCAWIAEDVGKDAPHNYRIDEKAATAGAAPAFGSFSLSRPKKGWPPGKYRVEIYLNTESVLTLPFAIEAARGD